MNYRQCLTLQALREDCEWFHHSPVSMRTEKFGNGGVFENSVVAIATLDDNPAPNPIVGLWCGGDFHEVRSDEDYARWVAILGLSFAVQREDDEVFVILEGGAFCRLTDHDALSDFARAWTPS